MHCNWNYAGDKASQMHTRVLRIWKGTYATFIQKLRESTFQQLRRRYNQVFREKRHKQHICSIQEVTLLTATREPWRWFRVCPLVFHLMTTRSREVNTCPGWVSKALVVRALKAKSMISSSLLLYPAASNLLCFVLFNFSFLACFVRFKRVTYWKTSMT